MWLKLCNTRRPLLSDLCKVLHYLTRVGLGFGWFSTTLWGVLDSGRYSRKQKGTNRANTEVIVSWMLGAQQVDDVISLPAFSTHRPSTTAVVSVPKGELSNQETFPWHKYSASHSNSNENACIEPNPVICRWTGATILRGRTVIPSASLKCHLSCGSIHCRSHVNYFQPNFRQTEMGIHWILQRKLYLWWKPWQISAHSLLKVLLMWKASCSLTPGTVAGAGTLGQRYNYTLY